FDGVQRLSTANRHQNRHRPGGRFSEFLRPCATPVTRAPTAPGLKSTARTNGSPGKRRRRSPPSTVSGRLMGFGEEGLESLVLGVILARCGAIRKASS